MCVKTCQYDIHERAGPLLQLRTTESSHPNLEYAPTIHPANKNGIGVKSRKQKFFSSQHTWMHVARHHDEIMDRNLGRYLAECWQAASTTEILRQIFGCMYIQKFMPPYKLHGASFEHTQSSIGRQHCNFRAQHIRQNLETEMSTEVYGKQASVQ
jgi:hypothetical protein